MKLSLTLGGIHVSGELTDALSRYIQLLLIHQKLYPPSHQTLTLFPEKAKT